MWKKKPEVEEPFDEASYVPEPTNHFGVATDNMQKVVAGGALVGGGYYLIRELVALGIFN